VQESGNITCALRNGHDLDRVRKSPVDDQVSAHRPKQNRISSKVIPLVAHTGRVANSVKRIKQPGYPRVGGIDTIFGD
jgi:hypothetical protein